MANSILLGNIRGQRGFSTQVQFSTDGSAWHDNYQTGDQYKRESLQFNPDGSVMQWSSAMPTAAQITIVPTIPIGISDNKRCMIVLGKIKDPQASIKDYACLQIYPIRPNRYTGNVPLVFINAIQIYNSTNISFNYIKIGITSKFQAYKFMYNGEYHYGVEIAFYNAGFYNMFAINHNMMQFTPFALQFFNNETNQTLNSEVYYSLTTDGIIMSNMIWSEIDAYMAAH